MEELPSLFLGVGGDTYQDAWKCPSEWDFAQSEIFKQWSRRFWKGLAHSNSSQPHPNPRRGMLWSHFASEPQGGVASAWAPTAQGCGHKSAVTEDHGSSPWVWAFHTSHLPSVLTILCLLKKESRSTPCLLKGWEEAFDSGRWKSSFCFTSMTFRTPSTPAGFNFHCPSLSILISWLDCITSALSSRELRLVDQLSKYD